MATTTRSAAPADGSAGAESFRAATDPAHKPFTVWIGGPGFGASAVFATEDEAYAEATRIRQGAESGELVRFTSKFGHQGDYRVGEVRILRWNPLTGGDLSHARSWNIADPAPDALTALPDDWYFEPLPADWRTPATAEH